MKIWIFFSLGENYITHSLLQARGQEFLRVGAIQRADGPNEAEVEIRLSEAAFRAFRREYDMKTCSQKRNVDISQNMFEL